MSDCPCLERALSGDFPAPVSDRTRKIRLSATAALNGGEYHTRVTRAAYHLDTEEKTGTESTEKEPGGGANELIPAA